MERVSFRTDRSCWFSSLLTDETKKQQTVSDTNVFDFLCSKHRVYVPLHQRLYFAKEDERLLRKLAAKIKASSPDAGSSAAELSELGKIVNKYNMSEEDKKSTCIRSKRSISNSNPRLEREHEDAFVRSKRFHVAFDATLDVFLPKERRADLLHRFRTFYHFLRFNMLLLKRTMHLVRSELIEWRHSHDY